MFSFRYEFEAGLWLAPNKDDKEYIRELAAVGPKVKHPLASCEYTLQTFTGPVKHAGTDADVFAIVYGTNGDSGLRPLRHSASNRCDIEV